MNLVAPTIHRTTKEQAVLLLTRVHLASLASILATQRGNRKRNGGFKRLLQQELLDQFDRLGKR